MALISQADLEARLGRSLTSDEATAFLVINSATQSYVENTIGSSVEAVSETTRYFDGGVQHLRIDPCTSITALKQVDDDGAVVYTYDTTDYTTDPKNKTCKTMIRHRSGPFMNGMNNISVTAKFSIYEDTGYLNIVKNAMLDFLASEIQNVSNITKESIEGYSVEYAQSESQSALAPIKYLFPEI